MSLPYPPAGQPVLVFMAVARKETKCVSACVKFDAIPWTKANYMANPGVSAEGFNQRTWIMESLKKIEAINSNHLSSWHGLKL